MALVRELVPDISTYLPLFNPLPVRLYVPLSNYFLLSHRYFRMYEFHDAFRILLKSFICLCLSTSSQGCKYLDAILMSNWTLILCFDLSLWVIPPLDGLFLHHNTILISLRMSCLKMYLLYFSPHLLCPSSTQWVVVMLKSDLWHVLLLLLRLQQVMITMQVRSILSACQDKGLIGWACKQASELFLHILTLN